ncbi:MAG: phage holin family protein [Acidimicrobiales bacterium]
MADSDKGLTALTAELWDLVLAYVKQETIDPLKSLVRFVGWGLAGAVCLGLGLVLLSLAGLRALQLELAPHLSGNWSWVPYLAVAAFAGVLIGILVRAIGTEKRRVDAHRTQLDAQKGRVG